MPLEVKDVKNLLDGVRAIIFDLDGTLLDSTGAWNIVNRSTFLSRGMDYPDDFMDKISGKTAIDAATYCIKEYNFNDVTPKELADKWKDIYIELFRTQVSYTPGAIEFARIAKSRGMLLAIGTACPHGAINAFFSERPKDRELFDAIVSCDDVSASKPDPAIFLECFKRLGIDASEALIFEDSIHGLEAARRSGAKAVAMLTGPHPPTSRPDLSVHVASTFTELLSIDQ
ncbi:Hydrolase, putative [Giardia lamblia P15]|uniref:Hydrolase, putative n=1 Tax=Giardia intestinalis (strain P15) TaxID=658858 RepID=E1F3K9_GIAIA|nr:Hydrolase, putative [Giardia lamblia P15]